MQHLCEAELGVSQGGEEVLAESMKGGRPSSSSASSCTSRRLAHASSKGEDPLQGGLYARASMVVGGGEGGGGEGGGGEGGGGEGGGGPVLTLLARIPWQSSAEAEEEDASCRPDVSGCRRPPTCRSQQRLGRTEVNEPRKRADVGAMAGRMRPAEVAEHHVLVCSE
eukprot:760061-Hanusia_phi.AAC.4